MLDRPATPGIRLRHLLVPAIVGLVVAGGAVQAIAGGRSPLADLARASATAVPKPRIVWDPIPFGARRRAETAAYAERHYGLHTYKLINPHVIVIHYTDGPQFRVRVQHVRARCAGQRAARAPGVCAHLVIDSAGVIHQLVSVGIICRHTVGLNWTAIGIEHVGYSDQQILNDPHELTQASGSCGGFAAASTSRSPTSSATTKA